MSEELRRILDLMIYAQADLATGESAAKVYWSADDAITFSIARKQIEKAMIKLGIALTYFPNINDDKEVILPLDHDHFSGYVRVEFPADRSKQSDTSDIDNTVRDQFGIDTMHDVWPTTTVSPQDQGN